MPNGQPIHSPVSFCALLPLGARLGGLPVSPARKTLAELDVAAERAAACLRAVSHPGRLRVVCQLTEGEQTAGQLIQGTGLSGPALSQHAAILEAAGVIARRRDAQSVFYRLSGPEGAALAKLLHKLFCGPNAGGARPVPTRKGLRK